MTASHKVDCYQKGTLYELRKRELKKWGFFFLTLFLGLEDYKRRAPQGVG